MRRKMISINRHQCYFFVLAAAAAAAEIHVSEEKQGNMKGVCTPYVSLSSYPPTSCRQSTQQTPCQNKKHWQVHLT